MKQIKIIKNISLTFVILLVLSSCSDYPSWNDIPSRDNISNLSVQDEVMIQKLTKEYQKNRSQYALKEQHPHTKKGKNSPPSKKTSPQTSSQEQSKDASPFTQQEENLPNTFNQTRFLYTSLFFNKNILSQDQKHKIYQTVQDFLSSQAEKIYLTPKGQEVPQDLLQNIKHILQGYGIDPKDIDISSPSPLPKDVKNTRWIIDISFVY